LPHLKKPQSNCHLSIIFCYIKDKNDSGQKEKKALEIIKRLKEAGFMAYWVGGCVRDLLLNRRPYDYDNSN
jgi:poly(A) polymerase